MIDGTGLIVARQGEKPWHQNVFRAPVVYVVAWPDRGIVKVGRSIASRWVMFQDRGAICLGLAPYPTLRRCLDAEKWLLRELAQDYEWAFDEPCPAAEEILGHHGAGWSECFLLGVESAVLWMASLPCVTRAVA